MPASAPSGNRTVFSASSIIASLANDLSQIRRDDRLTYADIGAVLGKSEDQAAKYCDGTAVMDAVTFARGKREWNGRFTGSLDRLCETTRIGQGDDRERECSVLKAALALSVALADGKLTDDEIRKNRGTLEAAKQAIEEVLARLTVRDAA